MYETQLAIRRICCQKGQRMLREVNIRKVLVDGNQWGQWQGYHIPVSEQYTTIWAPMGTEMHWQPGTWICHKHQLSYFWPNEWHVLHIGYDNQGNFASGYCDVVLPIPEYSNTDTEMIYIDLYVDVVVRDDYSVYTKDQEVFERAAQRYPVVEQSRQQSFAALAWLEEHAQNWTGPFAYVPRQLSRTDFHLLDSDKASTILRTLIAGE
jgi:protein associated with RNAse G/E